MLLVCLLYFFGLDTTCGFRTLYMLPYFSFSSFSSKNEPNISKQFKNALHTRTINFSEVAKLNLLGNLSTYVKHYIVSARFLVGFWSVFLLGFWSVSGRFPVLGSGWFWSVSDRFWSVPARFWSVLVGSGYSKRGQIDHLSLR